MSVDNVNPTRPSPTPRTDNTPTVQLPAVVHAHGAHHIERLRDAVHVSALTAGRPPLTRTGMHRQGWMGQRWRQMPVRVVGGVR